jgi:hypothetical protein
MTGPWLQTMLTPSSDAYCIGGGSPFAVNIEADASRLVV